MKSKNEKLVSLQSRIINSLASLVENRDEDTGNHILRTSAYVEIIARKAFEHGLWSETIDEHYIELIKSAAPMHDVGKIVVPNHILKRPEKLTAEEFEQLKLHTTEGKRIIEEIIGMTENKNYIKIASEIATSHHERWDGSGYPYQYAKEEIPLSARIMAIETSLML
ncbi:HD domain-containing phosphohydrolase [Treponema sp. Marseille-Q3903]|uniref:HD-GYP domain-containing protein n=1 Tax=Treponema sp. Marseille-Q3903 TaxID=2766703 RepID=UPI0016521685|nr:HD domain-containing protein [Treponema sp. Marseille-Q3903]